MITLLTALALAAPPAAPPTAPKGPEGQVIGTFNGTPLPANHAYVTVDSEGSLHLKVWEKPVTCAMEKDVAALVATAKGGQYLHLTLPAKTGVAEIPVWEPIQYTGNAGISSGLNGGLEGQVDLLTLDPKFVDVKFALSGLNMKYEGTLRAQRCP